MLLKFVMIRSSYNWLNQLVRLKRYTYLIIKSSLHVHIWGKFSVLSLLFLWRVHSAYPVYCTKYVIDSVYPVDEAFCGRSAHQYYILFKENRLTTRGQVHALCTEENYLPLVIIQNMRWRRDIFPTSIYWDVAEFTFHIHTFHIDTYFMQIRYSTILLLSTTTWKGITTACTYLHIPFTYRCFNTLLCLHPPCSLSVFYGLLKGKPG